MLEAPLYVSGTIQIASGNVRLKRGEGSITIGDPANIATPALDGQRRTVGLRFGDVREVWPADGEPGLCQKREEVVLRGEVSTHKRRHYPVDERQKERIVRRDLAVGSGRTIGLPAGVRSVADERSRVGLRVPGLDLVEVLPLEGDPYRSAPFEDVSIRLFAPACRPEPFAVHLSVGSVPLWRGHGWVWTADEDFFSSIAEELTESVRFLVGSHDYSLNLTTSEDVVRLDILGCRAEPGLLPAGGIELDREAFERAVATAATRYRERLDGAVGAEFDERLADLRGRLDGSIAADPLGQYRHRAVTNGPDPNAIGTLLDVVRTDPERRTEAVTALVDAGAGTAVEPLTAWLVDSDLSVPDQWLGIEALEALGDETTVEALLAFLETGANPAVVERAAEAIETLAADDANVGGRILEVAARLEDQDATGALAVAARDVDPGGAYDRALAALDADDPAERTLAVDTIDALAGAVTDQPQQVAARLLEDPVVDRLRDRALDDPSARVRERAVAALQTHATREAVPREIPRADVVALFEDDDPAVRARAVALAEHVDPPPVERLLAMLADETERVRETVAGTVASLADRDEWRGTVPPAVFVERVAGVLVDVDAPWGSRLVDALVDLDHPAGDEALLSLLDDGALRGSQLSRAVTRLGATSLEDSVVAERLARTLRDAEDGTALLRAGRALRRYYPDIPLDILRKCAIEAGHHQRAKRSVELLSGFVTDPKSDRDSAARSALLEAAYEGENPWAIRELRELYPDEAVEWFREIAADDEARNTARTAAIDELADAIEQRRLRPEDHLAAVFETAARSDDADVRSSVASALADLTTASQAWRENQRVRETLQYLSRTGTAQIAARALSARPDDPVASEAFREYLMESAGHHEDSRVRKAAVEVLGERLVEPAETVPDAVVRVLLDRLATDESWSVRVAACGALSPIDDRRVRATLERRVLDESHDLTRERLLTTLANDYAPDAPAPVCDTLARVARADDAAVRAEAIDALGAVPAETASLALAGVATTDPLARLRKKAVDELAVTNDRIRATLERIACRDEAVPVRLAAIDRLAARIGPSRGPLERLARDDPDAVVASRAADAIGEREPED